MKDLRFADAPFDVIWMGSLLTHLSPRASEDVWAMLRSNLRPGGILALSTHGPEILGRLDEWVPHGATQHDRLSRDLNATGIAYLQYPHYRRVGYGVTFHTSEALRTKVDDVFGGGQRLSFRPKGWLETQDLYVFRIPGAASHPGRRGGTPPPW